MNTKQILLIICVTLSLASCVRKEVANLTTIKEGDCIYLTAKMEAEAPTKTTLSSLTDGKYYPLWEEADSLAVFTKAGEPPSAFSLIEGSGGTTATFTGPSFGNSYIALFPYNKTVYIDENRLVFQLPEEQFYRPGSIASKGFPMIAISETGELAFKNLCSIIRLSITGSGMVKGITLRSESKVLSGMASVGLDFDDDPRLEMKEGGSHEVRLKGLAFLDKQNAKDFYIVVPAAVYDGFTILIETFSGTISKSLSHEIILTRSQLRPVTPFMIEAPAIDLDNLPSNQIWYRTKSGNIYSPPEWGQYMPTNATIVSHDYDNGYGIIQFDSDVIALNDYAFNAIRRESTFENDDVCELHLPDCVERIGLFAVPQHLDSLRIPADIEDIGLGNLSNIDIVYGPGTANDNCSVIAKGVLLGISTGHPKDYTTPDGVEKIKNNCFGSTYYERITISEGVRELENGALDYTNAGEIYFPESIELMGWQHWINAKGFYGSSHCTSADHVCLISPRDKKLVGVISGKDGTVFTIPDGIKSIATTIDWPNLQTVVFPESFVNFQSLNAFFQCPLFERMEGPLSSEDGKCLIKNGTLIALHGSGIKEYSMPSGIRTTRMGCLYATAQCDIEQLIVSEGVESLGQYSFEGAQSLRSVTFPTTIKLISSQVFDGDLSLESVYLPVRVPPQVLGGPGDTQFPQLKVYVPEEAYDDYMSNPNWSTLWGSYLAPYHFDRIDPPAPYESSDYSSDGAVTVLQKASEGQGIDLIFMGDAYSDRMIADGTYLTHMEKMNEMFFAIEPYRSFRHLFNVYVVNVVSLTEEYSDYNSGTWALGSIINPNASIVMNGDACIEYAKKAIPDERLDEVTIIAVCNAPGFGQIGTTFMMTRNEPQGDYGAGLGLAAFTFPWEPGLLQHEAGGHAFGKLGDEYHSRDEGNKTECPDDVKENYAQYHQIGWYKNIDIVSSHSDVLWAHFLSDQRYAKERLGVYEGAGMIYAKGLYRPSENGVMNDGNSSFNAPSREAIYYRIHKLAYGPEWEYNYEDFVKWDQGAKNIHPTATMQSVSGKKTYEVREPLSSKPFNPDEWTVTVMK